MPDSAAAVEALAGAVARLMLDPETAALAYSQQGHHGDPVLASIPMSTEWIAGNHLADLRLAAIAALDADPAFDSLKPKDGMHPSVFYETGGRRIMQVGMFAVSLIQCALQRLYLLRQELTEDVLVAESLANLAAFADVAAGGPVEVMTVHGLGGIALPDGAELELPWGTLMQAPLPSAIATGKAGAFTTALLMEKRSVEPLISFAGHHDGHPDRMTREEQLAVIADFLPLAFAVATGSSSSQPLAPTTTFVKDVLPFELQGRFLYGFKYSWDPLVISDDKFPAVVEWCERVDRDHPASLKVAARRIASAVSQRYSEADAVVDAVTALETLVGVTPETTFRVTAALTILLVDDPAERPAFWSRLKRIYGARSTIVHGGELEESDLVEYMVEINQVCLDAVRVLYERGDEWLTYTPQERCDRLILGW